MNIIGKEVIHTKFGIGTIAEINENKMRVHFDSDIKTFIYPDSFEHFFTIQDEYAKKHINLKIDEINRLKQIEMERKEKEEHYKMFKRKLKIRVNSQGVFDVDSDEWNNFLKTHTTTVGMQLSGLNKGKPRIPRGLNMNSACVLTMKPEKALERDRIILGVFMTPHDFIGKNCETGIISSHEKYCIKWNPEHEEILFWDYFSDDVVLDKWGGSKMKYISINVVKRLLEDMINLTSDQSVKEEIQEFYQYFCDLNHL